MIRTVVALLALTASGLAAQQPALVGTWTITWPGEVRMENDVQSVVMVTGTLTVAPQGDSLVGNLVTDPSPRLPPRPPLRLAAAKSAEPVTFETRSQATLNVNGEQTTATAISVWTFRAAGDSLKGTIERRIEGPYSRRLDPQPITGIRLAK